MSDYVYVVLLLVEDEPAATEVLGVFESASEAGDFAHWYEGEFDHHWIDVTFAPYHPKENA
jgi:hypothetical protein